MSDHIHHSSTLIENDVTQQGFVFTTVRFHIHKSTSL